MTGYVRADGPNNIADGNIINAADLDGEFDAIVAGFNASTGHKHDGTAAEGAPITKVGPAQDVVVSSSNVTPKTTNIVDIGSAALKFKDVYLTGTVNADSLTASQAVFTNASKGLVSNAITGTGNVVMSTSPTLVTPALGTPSSVTLTNATGLPVSTGISGLGTGVATLLATPSSANLAAAVTDETGSGSLVFATSPTLVTPALGTPSSVTLTNATGLPVSTGISGLGTGVATFLATPSSSNLIAAVTDETGTGSLVFATSPTLVTPALGIPSSATLTNATGLPISTGVSGLGTGVATFLATPSSANLIAAVTNETGTGSLVFATSPTLVTPILGTPTSATLTNATGLPLTTGVTGTLPIANGGTGTSSPAIVAGTNITVSGTWPNQTINSTASGSGDVVGPASATDNALVRFDSTTGKLIQNSVVTVADTTGNMAGVGTLSVGGELTYGGVTLTNAVTGTGKMVLDTSPTLVTPALGTPASGVLTNATGLPISTGVSGLGTGIATALAVNVGTAGAPVVNGGALGTPSSGTATNLTGLPLSTGVTGTLPIANGGTGQTTANTSFNALAPSQTSNTGKYLTTDGTNSSWATVSAGAALSNDTTTATNLFPIFADATTGTPTTVYTGNAKLLYKPSTGEFQASVPVALNGIVVNSQTVATSYTIAAGYSGMSAGPITVASGQSVTISSGSRWVIQ